MATAMDMSRNWWSLLVRGILAIIFGLVALFFPGITLLALVLLFGAYAFVDGIFSLAGIFVAAEHRQRWWPLLIEGILGIAAGVLTVLWPGLTTVGLLLVISFWALTTGIF